MANSYLIQNCESSSSCSSSSTSGTTAAAASSTTSTSTITSNHAKLSANNCTTTTSASLALNQTSGLVNGHQNHNNYQNNYRPSHHHPQHPQVHQRSRQRWKLLSKAVHSKSYQLETISIDGGSSNGSLEDEILQSENLVETENNSIDSTQRFGERTTTSPIQRLSSDTTNLTIQTYGLMKYDFVKTMNGNYDQNHHRINPRWISCQWNQFYLNEDDCVTEKPDFTNNNRNLKLFIKFVENHFNSFQELAGFDNSGNVRIWPCEELLAYLVGYGMLREKISGTVICELGAGMTALAGLVIVALGLHRSIYLTDGNPRCVQNIESLVERNFPLNHHPLKEAPPQQRSNNISVQQLRWEVSTDYEHLRNRIETIICADCLFVDRRHRELLNTIDTILVDHDDDCDESGKVFLLAPQRGTTMQQFVNLVNNEHRRSDDSNADQPSRFTIEVIEHFNRPFFQHYHTLVEQLVQNTGADLVNLKESYYPYLLVMKRRKKTAVQ